MDIVVDANILFAALIKDSITSDLLFVDNLHLYAPEFLIVEFGRHKEEILKKTHRSYEDFQRLLDILEKRITVVPESEIRPFLEEAGRLSPDPKDIVYLALALRIGGYVWSNDSRLKRQDKIKVYSTRDLLTIIKSWFNP